MPTASAPDLAPNVSSLEFWSRPAESRAATFAHLRRTAPVSVQPPSDFGFTPGGRSFWAVTRHADVQHVSRTPDLFCSGQGVGMGDVPIEFLELNASFLVMDAPRHTELRRIVSGAFTPRRVAQLNDAITAEANRIVDHFVDAGGGDAVTGLARKLPLWTVCNMMGVPESMRDAVYDAAEAQIAAQDPSFAPEGKDGGTVALEAALAMHALAMELVAARRADPGDDILSTLVHAPAAGEPLSDQMLGAIFLLFATAGNDTTRTTTSHALKLFADHPDQWARLRSDPELVPTAVEEVIRYATPIIHFRRTTTTDVELGGVAIRAGEPVVLFYESANRDEGAFADPDRFDVTRSPNPHVGFGGGGVHFCLGANLARAQLRALFSRLVERVGAFEVGAPDYLVSNFAHGIKAMPVSVAAR